MLDSQLIRLPLATAVLRLFSLAAFIAITTAASSCDADIIATEGVVAGLDVVERVITLEQRRAADKVVPLDLVVTKEAWDKAQLAAGDRVVLSYDTNLQTVIAVQKMAPPPPEEIKRESLSNAADSFLEERKSLVLQLRDIRKQNDPTFERWRRLNQELKDSQKQLRTIPVMAPWGVDIIASPRADKLRGAIANTLTQKQQCEPAYNIACDEEARLVKAMVNNCTTLLNAMSPIAGRDGQESHKRDELSRITDAAPDLWEANVWIAMLWILEGDSDMASTALSAVRKSMEDKRFLTTRRISLRPEQPPFLCATAQLYIRSLRLLGNTNALNAFLQKWDEQPYPDDGFRLTMLLCKAARSMCLSKWPEATAGYRQAVRIAKDDDEGGWIYGEAAWLMAASPEAKDLDMEAATSYAEKALTLCGNSCWVAWRAKAAVCAAEGEWNEAAKCLDEAAQSIPLILAEDLKAQRLAYNGKQTFSITMP